MIWGERGNLERREQGLGEAVTSGAGVWSGREAALNGMVKEIGNWSVWSGLQEWEATGRPGSLEFGIAWSFRRLRLLSKENSAVSYGKAWITGHCSDPGLWMGTPAGLWGCVSPAAVGMSPL